MVQVVFLVFFFLSANLNKNKNLDSKYFLLRIFQVLIDLSVSIKGYQGGI